MDDREAGDGWVRRHGATVFVVVGLLVLVFAAYNAFYIPALDPADPDRGWTWLTEDPDTVSYIKFYFRIQGTWQLAYGVLVLAAAYGLRQRRRWAWIGLWSVPLVLVLVGVQMPWTLPVLALPLLATVLALVATRHDVR